MHCPSSIQICTVVVLLSIIVLQKTSDASWSAHLMVFKCVVHAFAAHHCLHQKGKLTGASPDLTGCLSQHCLVGYVTVQGEPYFFRYRWRFTKTSQGKRGHYIKVNHWPALSISRTEDWGWKLENCWVEYRSLEQRLVEASKPCDHCQV